MARFAADLNFMQEGRENLAEFSPFLVFSYHRYVGYISFQAPPTKWILLHVCLFCQYTLPSPPTHQKGKIPQNYYLKSGMSGAFSACKCVQFESPGLFFHLLWYAYLIHCPRLDLIWCTLVQGVMVSHFRRTETACCFLCFICWPTILIYCASSWFYLHMKCREHFNLLAMNNDS